MGKDIDRNSNFTPVPIMVTEEEAKKLRALEKRMHKWGESVRKYMNYYDEGKASDEKKEKEGL